MRSATAQSTSFVYWDPSAWNCFPQSLRLELLYYNIIYELTILYYMYQLHNKFRSSASEDLFNYKWKLNDESVSLDTLFLWKYETISEANCKYELPWLLMSECYKSIHVRLVVNVNGFYHHLNMGNIQVFAFVRQRWRRLQIILLSW